MSIDKKNPAYSSIDDAEYLQKYRKKIALNNLNKLHINSDDDSQNLL